ncbi:MAG: DUF4442 domain-containing protein [Lewinellaceae bacterium]|nr:DUF4442 domain-containing protein [Lewinella sp.]MCB9279515.1 DUF4442 domain-containing protein [Lewinellaceae bacterium]
MEKTNALNTPWKMWLYYFRHLPSLVFWGVRIRSVNPEGASVTIPFSWRTQNPFKSTYFAALCGAAELSTGVLALLAMEGQGPISMLVVSLEADFVKKAVTRTTFTCNDGEAFRETIQKAITTGEAQVFTAVAEGVQTTGEKVAEVRITWSFKVKKR